MKKLIALVLILVIIPFFIVSEDSIDSEVRKIKSQNIKNPETANWEYVKDRAFDKNGVLLKGYDKPVLITLDESATYKDSVIVQDFIKELKILMPSVIIGLERSKEVKGPYHNVNFTFRKDSTEFDRFMIKTDLLDGSVVGRTASKKMIIKGYNGSQYSHLNFKFIDNITDQYRKMYIEYGLLKTIFSTTYMNDSFNHQFPVNLFNANKEDQYSTFFGGMDKFLLEKLYAPDFTKQFHEYLDAEYPWRYSNSFLNKKLAERKAMLFVVGLGLLVFVLMLSVFQNKKFKYSFLNYFLPVLFLTCTLTNLTQVYEYLTRFNSYNEGGVESIMFMFVLVLPFILIVALLLWLFDKFILKENINFTLGLLTRVIFTFITFNSPILLALLFSKDVNINDTKFQDFYFPMLFISMGLAVGRGVLLYLNHISQSLVKAKDVELSKLKQVNAEAEVRLLQSQINPHFLYNALNSIASLALVDGKKTQKMSYSLSNLFKYSINRKGKIMSTIKDEIKMVENYLDIEKIRFGERLQFVIEVDKEIESIEIPLFVIQPLVENTIKHGISKIVGNGKITLKIGKEENEIKITVKDNGPAFSEGLVNGHGLQSVYDLLQLSYGDRASLNWQNTPEKNIQITIPL